MEPLPPSPDDDVSGSLHNGSGTNKWMGNGFFIGNLVSLDDPDAIDGDGGGDWFKDGLQREEGFCCFLVSDLIAINW